MSLFRHKNNVTADYYVDPSTVNGPQNFFKSDNNPVAIILNGGASSFAIAILEINEESFGRQHFKGYAHFTHNRKIYGYGFRWNGNPESQHYKHGYPVAGVPKENWVPVPELFMKSLNLGDHGAILDSV